MQNRFSLLCEYYNIIIIIHWRYDAFNKFTSCNNATQFRKSFLYVTAPYNPLPLAQLSYTPIQLLAGLFIDAVLALGLHHKIFHLEYYYSKMEYFHIIAEKALMLIAVLPID